jgi:hypothetical protein
MLHTDTNNTQTLVHQDGVVGSVVATPIWATVTDLLAHAQGSRLELLHIGMAVDLSVSSLLVSLVARTCGRQRYHTCWAVAWDAIEVCVYVREESRRQSVKKLLLPCTYDSPTT